MIDHTKKLAPMGIIPLLVSVVVFVFGLLAEDSYAADGALSDGPSCTSIGGSWDGVSSTCTVHTLSIGTGRTLMISAGVTLNNDGTISNSGTINNTGTISNYNGAIISNTGTINNKGTINNTGTISNYNGAIISNTGTINNNFIGSTFNNSISATFKADHIRVNTGSAYIGGVNIDRGTINNKGTINNTGALINDGGIINNKGTINNTGTISNNGIDYGDNGTINNARTINNSGTIDNARTINNSGTISNTGTINNKGSINNVRQITNLYNGTINNYGGGTINSFFGTINNKGTINNFCAGHISGTINGNQTVDKCRIG